MFVLQFIQLDTITLFSKKHVALSLKIPPSSFNMIKAYCPVALSVLGFLASPLAAVAFSGGVTPVAPHSSDDHFVCHTKSFLVLQEPHKSPSYCSMAEDANKPVVPEPLSPSISTSTTAFGNEEIPIATVTEVAQVAPLSQLLKPQ